MKNYTNFSQYGKQGIEIICYGLQPQKCEVVFESEEMAQRIVRTDFSTLALRKNTYFLSDYAIYGQQARALSELMYQCLYEPSVFNSTLVHNERRMFGFIQIWNTGHGEFIAKPKSGDRIEIPNMPTVREMYDCLREKGFFADTHSPTGIGLFSPKKIKPFIKLLNLVLEGKIQQPDESLSPLIDEA